jgi:hypothetical protein
MEDPRHGHHPPAQVSALFTNRTSVDSNNTFTVPPVVVLKGQLHLTLPNGKVITGKNTLQAFDAVVKRSSNEPPNSIVAPTSHDVVAVAVETDILYSELAPDLVQEYLDAAAATPAIPWYKGRCTIVLLAIVVVFLAAGLGVYVSTMFAIMHPMQDQPFPYKCSHG